MSIEVFQTKERLRKLQLIDHRNRMIEVKTFEQIEKDADWSRWYMVKVGAILTVLALLGTAAVFILGGAK